MHIVVGLGNPGEEYAHTRHNAGRIAVEYFIKNAEKIAEKRDSKKAAKATGFEEFESSKKYSSEASEGEVNGEKVLALLPDTFMNKSGKALQVLITNAKKAEKLVVVQDDLDMPIGKIKIMFNRGSGGHKGVESIIRAIKTEAFVRIKIGICPTTPSGKPKKPTGDKLLDFIVGRFRDNEFDKIKAVSKRVAEALYVIIADSREAAMNEFNS